MSRIGSLLVLLAICCGACGRLPLKDPCFDSAYMALRFHPPDSMTDSQRSYLRAKDSECIAYQELWNQDYIPVDATEDSWAGHGAGVALIVFCLLITLVGALSFVKFFSFGR